MKVQLNPYQRIFLTLCLFLFFWIGGGFVLSLNLLLTGTLFLIAAISTMFYLPFLWLLQRIWTIHKWKEKERLGLSFLIVIPLLVGVLEAFRPHLKISLLFMTGLLFLLLLNVFFYKLNQRKAIASLKTYQIGFLSTSVFALILSFAGLVKYAYESLPIKETEIILFANIDPQMDILGVVFLLEMALLVFLLLYIFLVRKQIGAANTKLEAFKLGLFGKITIAMTVLFLGGLITENESLLEFIIPLYILGMVGIGLSWLVKQIKAIFYLKKEQTKMELLHLKSQVSPHFFFNTLNNLYGLVEKDSKKARTLILKLSEMMRYSIYEGQKEEVTLEEEIDYLKNYIELHRMRYHKAIKVDFEAKIQEGGYKVMPLLFIILLENAFKHGVENLINAPFVSVNIAAKADEICFEVENNFEQTKETIASGIGLKNLKRRLELVYQDRYDLSFSIKNDIYKARLLLKP